MGLKEILEKRAKLLKEARELSEKAAGEKRDLTSEEDQRHSAIMKEFDQLTRSKERHEQLADAERQIATQAINKGTGTIERGQDDPSKETREIPKSAKRELTKEERNSLLFAVGEGVRAVAGKRGPIGADEQRALQWSLDTAGGALVPPQEFVNFLIKAVDDLVFIRQLATKYTLDTAASLGVPTLTANPADADWTTELAIGGEDSTMAFGKRELKPYPLAKLLKVSEPLLRMSALDVGSLVANRLAYKFGITEEKAFLTGTGAGQPLGVFTASVDGISTARDVSTGNTTTAITFDGLKEAQYSLKAQYWARAIWMFNRTVLKAISKLKDGEGQYIWSNATQAGQPDRLLGLPFKMSEYVPNTMTTGLYVGIIGDFSWYWVVDTLSFRLQALRELYAATNQIGFVGRSEMDAMPVLEEAFSRVKLA